MIFIEWRPPPEVLSLLVSLLVSFCLMVCPPCRGLASPCLPHMCACVGWYLRLGWCDHLLSTPSLPLCPHCLWLCPPHVCLCCMVCLPSQGLVSLVSIVSLVSQLVSLLVSLCGGWSQFAFSPNCVLSDVLNAFLRSALVLGGVSAFPSSCLPSWLPNSVLLGVLNAFSCAWASSSKHFLNPPTVWCLRWCNWKSSEQDLVALTSLQGEVSATTIQA